MIFLISTKFLLQTMRMAKFRTAWVNKIKVVIEDLEKVSREVLLKWSQDNGMKANPDKYNLLVNNPIPSYPIKTDNKTVADSKCEKLVGIKAD